MVLDFLALGYDPGGDGSHGVAAVRVRGGSIVALSVSTQTSVEAATAWFVSNMSDGVPLVLGTDTLTVWSTGPAGWRPADRKLRAAYPAASKSVVSSNSLYGAMSVNGMMLMTKLRQQNPGMVISETHPKILYYALTSTLYAYTTLAASMNTTLAGWLRARCAPQNDDEWDALASAFAVIEGMSGRWTNDLHALPASAGESLIWPVGRTSYFWPALPP